MLSPVGRLRRLGSKPALRRRRRSTAAVTGFMGPRRAARCARTAMSICWRSFPDTASPPRSGRPRTPAKNWALPATSSIRPGAARRFCSAYYPARRFSHERCALDRDRRRFRGRLHAFCRRCPVVRCRRVRARPCGAPAGMPAEFQEPDRPARNVTGLRGPRLPRISAIALADGAGFEPAVDLRPRRFSRPVHSTALPPIRQARPGVCRPRAALAPSC